MFSPSQGTVDDRLAHIESTLPNLARLTEQSACFERLDKMALSMQELFNHESSIQSVLDSLVKDYNIQINQFGLNHRSFADFMAEMQIKANAIQEKIHHIQLDAKKDLDALNHSRVTLEANLTSIKNNSVSTKRVDEINELIAVMTVQQNAIKADMQSLRKEIEAQKVLIANVDMLANTVNRAQSNYSQTQHEFKSELNLLLTGVKQSVKDELLEMRKGLSNLAKDMDAKLAALPKPQTVDIEAIKQEMQQRFEPSSFEAKNANLRSSNNESKIVLLEKKVEQLFLLLNKYELTK